MKRWMQEKLDTVQRGGKKIAAAVLAASGAIVPAVSHAVMAQPDLSDVTTYIETGLTTVGALALAGLTLFVGLKLYKVARRAI